MGFPSFKSLCSDLALSEHDLRTNKTGSSAHIRGVLRGRGEKLELMKEFYPAAYKRYTAELLKRTEQPFDSKTLVSAIKSDEWALQAEMLDYALEMAEVSK